MIHFVIAFIIILIILTTLCIRKQTFVHLLIHTLSLSFYQYMCVFTESKFVAQKVKEGRTLCVVLISSPREPSL